MKTKIQIKDLGLELMNLYYQDGSLNTFEMELFDAKVLFNKETGEEIGADLILNGEITPSYISPRVEAMTAEEQDTLSHAALCLFEEGLEYEADFGDMEKIEISFEFNPFITDAQKTVNFNFFMGRLAQANNFSKLKIVRESVLAGSKGEHGWFFMKRDDASKFWAAYNLKKEQLNKYKKRSA